MPRKLKSREIDVLRMMIEQGTVASLREQLWAQLPDIRAWNSCGCGTCPSISLGNEETEYGDLPGSLVVGASTGEAGLLLFIDGARPGYLELYPHTEGITFMEFPPVAEVVVETPINK